MTNVKWIPFMLKTQHPVLHCVNFTIFANYIKMQNMPSGTD